MIDRAAVVQLVIGLVVEAFVLYGLRYGLPSLAADHLWLGVGLSLIGFVAGVAIGDALARLI